ncbi:hypothetical protein BJX66DRAFT_306621 [Aspergillus keveii]|uniref:F-box domain-containing protein n=1 Tax=Aspergillus keveii TaxID=714993 RepID=A0ABR4G234_9EURO
MSLQPTVRLSSVPYELLSAICEQLEFPDHVAVSQANKRLRSFIMAADLITAARKLAYLHSLEAKEG